MSRKLWIGAASFLLTACMKSQDAGNVDSLPPAAADGSTASATAVVRDQQGRELGTVTLSEVAGAIAVSGTLRGLPPGSLGMHLHTAGLCETPFESAGSHWNPSSTQHGIENPAGPHLGDLPNLAVAADSTAVLAGGTVGGNLTDLRDFDGAAFVVHATRDDQQTDPSGNSGARIACGVVM